MQTYSFNKEHIVNSSFPQICLVASVFGGFMLPIVVIFSALLAMVLCIPGLLVISPTTVVMGYLGFYLACYLCRLFFRWLSTKTSGYKYLSAHPEQKEELVKSMYKYSNAFSVENRELEIILGMITPFQNTKQLWSFKKQ